MWRCQYPLIIHFKRIFPKKKSIWGSLICGNPYKNHPPVITIFRGGMFTIPTWVVKIALFYPHYIPLNPIE